MEKGATGASSRRVDLLKFYRENHMFINKFKMQMQKHCVRRLRNHDQEELLYMVQVFNHMVQCYNHAMGITDEKPEFHNGLSVPKLKILTALIAQKEGYIIYPSLGKNLNFDRAPKRFMEKFRALMTEGLWMVGAAIEDSLSPDRDTNRGNPFRFKRGDLAFWWAAIVIMDWIKFCQEEKEEKHPTCVDFYSDPYLNQKKYWQNSAISSLQRVPMQFLYGEDFENFISTIANVSVQMYKYGDEATPAPHCTLHSKPQYRPWNSYGNNGYRPWNSYGNNGYRPWNYGNNGYRRYE